MKRSTEVPAFVVKVHPRRSLVRNGVLSYALLSLPLFGTLYFFSTSSAVWFSVLSVHMLTLGIAALVVSALHRRLHRSDFHRDLRARLPRQAARGCASPRSRPPHSCTPTGARPPRRSPQLLVRCTDNNRVLRMRGIFWSEADMRAVAAVITRSAAIVLDERTEPITARTFFAEYPGSAYWFENRPAIIVAAVIVTLLAAARARSRLHGPHGNPGRGGLVHARGGAVEPLGTSWGASAASSAIASSDAFSAPNIFSRRFIRARPCCS